MKYHEIDSQGNLVQLVDESKWEWIDYPEENLIDERSGFKVGWRTYSVEASADECAYAAMVNGVIKAMQGFDFGYQYPAFVKQVDNGWEVTVA